MYLREKKNKIKQIESSLLAIEEVIAPALPRQKQKDNDRTKIQTRRPHPRNQRTLRLHHQEANTLRYQCEGVAFYLSYFREPYYEKVEKQITNN